MQPLIESWQGDNFFVRGAGGPHLRQASITRLAFRYRLRNQITGAPLLGFFENGLATVVASVVFHHP